MYIIASLFYLRLFTIKLASLCNRPSIFMPNLLNTRGNASKFSQLQTQINFYVQSFFQKQLNFGIRYLDLSFPVVKLKHLRN